MGVLRWTGKHWGGHTRGCLNIWGCWRHQGSVQMHGGIQTYGGIKMPPNIWGSTQCPQVCRTYMTLKKIRGVSTYWGCWGNRVVSKCMGASKHMGVSRCPQIWGVKSMPPKCKSYRPLKKIRGVQTYGVLGASGGIQMHGGHPNISYRIGYHFVSLWVSIGRGV